MVGIGVSPPRQEAKAMAVKTGARILGAKVRNRDIDQTGVIDTIATNSAGTWYYVTTQSGMSIGWWHETDLDGAPKSVPPSEKRRA